MRAFRLGAYVFFALLVGRYLSAEPKEIGAVTALRFRTEGWSRDPKVGVGQRWVDRPGAGEMALSESGPDGFPSLSDEKGLRRFFRQRAEHVRGGIVSVERINVKGLLGVRTILKYPQSPSGITYAALLIFPTAGRSFTLAIKRYEEAPTGQRDAVILDRMLESGRVKVPTNGSNNLVGWWADPYDPNIVSGVLKNLSDGEEYDSEFPDHPLSRVRRDVRAIEKTLEFDPSLLALQKGLR